MRHNPVKRALANGEVSLGTMVFEFATPGISRVAAGAGAEFVVFDQEHTGWDMDTTRTLLATARATDTVPLVRVPAMQYHLISRPLDAGASGVMVPMVESEEEAQSLVRFSRYPPVGVRGAAFGILHDDYDTQGDPIQKMERANDEVLLIAQIETTTGVENVELIAAVEGLDVLWIGHNDLTNSMGIPGRFDHPDYLRAVDRLLEACRENGKAAGIMATGVEDAAAQLRRGFRCVAYWGDLWIYGEALREGLAAVRRSLR